MPGKRAKILSIADVGDLLAFASCTRHPLRNAVMVLLSAKAGLRAGEIANLTWDMVVDATGQVSGLIELADNAAKKRSGRSIPIHPDLAVALATWRQVAPSGQKLSAGSWRARPWSDGRRPPHETAVVGSKYLFIEYGGQDPPFLARSPRGGAASLVPNRGSRKCVHRNYMTSPSPRCDAAPTAASEKHLGKARELVKKTKGLT
jgi:integrase